MKIHQDHSELEFGKQQACKPYFNTTSSSLTSRLLFTAILSTFSGGFHFGYLISVVNPLSQILQQFLIDNIKLRYSIELTSSQLALVWSSLAGCLFIGAVIGSYLVVNLLPQIGPRRTLLLSACVSGTGITEISLAEHYGLTFAMTEVLILLITSPIFGLAYVFNMVELLPISRILSGVGFGMGLAAQGVYLTEISPPEYRGVTNSLSGLVGNIAFLIASILGTPFVFGTTRMWKIIFFLEAIPCVIHIIANVTYFKESPKYLILNGESGKAEESLISYHGERCQTKRIIMEMKTKSAISENEMSFFKFSRDRSSMRALSLSVALNFSVAFSGIVAMSFFGTFLLRAIGFSEESSTIANCFCSSSSIVSALLATLAIDKINRRKLLISSLLILAVINILMMTLAISFESTKNSNLAWPFLVLFISFLFVFSIGIGPAAIFLGVELAPPGTISKMQSYSLSVQYIGSFICPVIYLSLTASIGHYAFILFIIPLTITAAYFYLHLPETKGKTQAEICELLSN